MGPGNHRRQANDRAVHMHGTRHKQLMKLLIPFVQVDDHNLLYENFLDTVAGRLRDEAMRIRTERAAYSADNDPSIGGTALAQANLLAQVAALKAA